MNILVFENFKEKEEKRGHFCLLGNGIVQGSFLP